MAPRAALHFTGYCFWFMWGIVVGYVVPRATHFTRYCCWFMRGLGQHTLLGITRSDVGRFHQWVQNNCFKNNSRNVEVTVSVSPPKLLKRISSHKQNRRGRMVGISDSQPESRGFESRRRHGVVSVSRIP
jgi:hypothetical protein